MARGDISYPKITIDDETLLAGDDNEVSACAGPRGSAMGLGLAVLGELQSKADGTRSQLYNDYGTINSRPAPYGGAATFDWIDTMIYVQGAMSKSVASIPVRIIRKVS